MTHTFPCGSGFSPRTCFVNRARVCLRTRLNAPWESATRLLGTCATGFGRRWLKRITNCLGTVEIDETYIGGKQRGHKGQLKNKAAVIGIRERGGHLHFIRAENLNQESLYEIIARNVDNIR